MQDLGRLSERPIRGEAETTNRDYMLESFLCFKLNKVLIFMKIKYVLILGRIL